MKKLVLFMTFALAIMSMRAEIIYFTDGNLKYQLNPGNNWVAVTGLSEAGQNLTTVRIYRLATYNGEKYYVKGVAANAFQNNTKLRSVIFETGPEVISVAAFKGCTALTSVELSAVNTIASSAFSGCTKLTSIYLSSYYPPSYTPDSATPTSGVTVYVPCFKGIIPRYKATAWGAFSKIETNTIECFPLRDYGGGSYGKCVFSALPSGKATGSPEVEMIVTDLDPDKEGSINITSTTSVNVTYVPRVIADSAFVGRTKLDGVSLGPVRTIGKAAFKGCSNLTSVTIPCDTIGEKAFEGCTSLANITLREGVKRVDSRAFAGTAITSLMLPSTIKEYGYVVNACNDCPNFKEYKVTAASEDYCANGGLLFNKNQTALIRVPVAKEPGEWEAAIPTTCTYIRAGACANNISDNLWFFSIPYGITTIGGYAFENLKGVGYLIIPSSVTRIDQYAFYKSSVTKVIVGSTTPLSLSTDVFYGMSKLELCVPVNAWEKYAQAAYWKEFKAIGGGGFDIRQYENGGYGTFMVTKVATASAPGEVSMVYDTFYTNRATKIPTRITDRGLTYNVVSLGDSVFVGNTAATALNIPAQVKNLPRWAFQGCTKLNTVTWEEGYEPTSMGYRAFWGSSIREFTVPSTVSVIQKEAFDNCPYLKKLIINRSLATTVYTNAYGVTNPNADLKVYVPWRRCKHWCDSVAKWSSTPTKYLNVWVSIPDNGFMEFSSYLPVKVPTSSGLHVYAAALSDANGNKNYAIHGDELQVKRSARTVVTPSNGYMAYGTPNTKYYLNYDTDYNAYSDDCFGILKPMHSLTSIPEEENGNRNFLPLSGSEAEFINASGNVRAGSAYVTLDGRSELSNIQKVRIVENLDMYARGDINRDGVVDVSDVNIAIDIVLGRASNNNYGGRADLDGNGIVDVSDVNALIDIVLGK